MLCINEIRKREGERWGLPWPSAGWMGMGRAGGREQGLLTEAAAGSG